jgi:hypothetical protein
MTNQFPGATKKVLSPAAQAVLTAYGNELLRPGPLISGRHPLAAALRAAADQVEWPAEVRLRIIASELEALNNVYSPMTDPTPNNLPMAYTVSWYTATTRAVIQRRPWWSLFGKDSLRSIAGWQRHAVTTDKKPDFETLRLIVSTLKSATHLRVEKGHPATSCVATTGLISTREENLDDQPIS